MALVGRLRLGSSIDRVWRSRNAQGGQVNGIVFRLQPLPPPGVYKVYESGALTTAQLRMLQNHECIDLVTPGIGLLDLNLEASQPIYLPKPPTVIDAPYLAQDVDVLKCTMGNWTNEPTQYDYQWLGDGVDAGHAGDTHIITPADIGKTYTCVVTASNVDGSASSTSNAVIVTKSSAADEPAAPEKSSPSPSKAKKA